MSSYDVIAQFYDSVVADPTKKALWLRELIVNHHPAAKSILELACGTGSILVVLAKDYDVTGLDNSAGMLEVARGKLPEADFIEANMADFNTGQSYDVVLCVYDSINHLLQFSEWQSLFANTAKHLNPNGLFIFDMNTVEFLNKLNESEPSVSHFSDNTMTIGAEPSDKAITTLKIEVAEKKSDDTMQLHKTDIPEMSFSADQVEQALREHFEILGKLGEGRHTAWTSSDDKVVYVCRLK